MFKSFRLLYPCLLLLGIASIANAQPDHRSSISGTIASPAGAVLANVPIQAVNLDNNQTRSTTSDAAGMYRFDDVAPGRYHMIGTYNGQPATPSAEITVGANEAVTVNLSVGPGTPTTAAPGTANPVTSVEISAAQGMAGPKIETPFNTKDLEYLPTPAFLSREGGRSYGAYNLSLLPAGVASNGGIGFLGPVVGGVWPSGNNYYIGAVDNSNVLNPGPIAYVSNEATSEFQTQQNQYSPEYGHAAGGQFENLVRTGSNGFHGDLYEYFMNNNLNANDQAFAREGITGTTRYDQNRLGAKIGAPLIHNRLFFFGDFEYIPLGFDNLPISSVYAPTAAGYATLAGLRGVSATNLSLLQGLVPAAGTGTSFVNVNGTSIPVGASTFAGRFFQNQFNGVGALDWNLGQNDKLQMRYDQNQLNANFNGASLPAFNAPTQTRAYLANLDETHNFSGAAINELRLGYSRYVNVLQPDANTFPGLTGFAFPTVGIQELGLTLGEGFTTPTLTHLNTFNLADNLNWTIGRNTIHIGADSRHFTGPEYFGAQLAGAYTYSSLGGFLLNQTPDVFGARTIGNLSYPTNAWDTYAYLKDDVKIRSNLDVSIGVRYEYVSVPLGVQRQSYNAAAGIPGALTFGQPGAETFNFTPQVGFAYSPGHHRDSVFRAGFGMNYDVSTYLAESPFLTPGLASTLYTTGRTATTGFFGNGVTPGAFFGPGAASGLSAQALTSGYFPRQELPYTMQWNADWEQTIMHSFILDIRYMGVRGVNYPLGQYLNQGAVVTAGNSLPLFYSAPSQATLNRLTTTLPGLQAQAALANPLASAGFTSPILTSAPTGSSTYNGLAVQAHQRFSGGFQFLASYTWSHLIDNVSPYNNVDPFFNMFVQGPRQSSIYDHRQRGTLTALWDMGAVSSFGSGWAHSILANMNLSGTFIYETGAFLPIASGLDTGLGAFAGSGVFVNPNGSAGIGSGVSPLTNSSGQTVAYLANNPNAQFVSGGLGTFPNSPSYLQMRPINDFDASWVKRFTIHDRFNIEFRADAFNVLNHPQYIPGSPDTIGMPIRSTSSFNFMLPTSPIFADPTGAFSSNPRMLQLALRLMF